MKSTGPSLKHDNPSEAGETCDNTKWNSHYARSCYDHQYYPQRDYKARCTRGPLVAGGERRGSGGTSVLVEGSQCSLHGASASENSCREGCAEILACIPNVHAECSIFVLYIKYIYTFICLMHFTQRKESSYITLEKYVYAVLIRASSHQFHMYQRCSQLFCLPKKVSSIITRSRLNRKHLCSTVTF